VHKYPLLRIGHVLFWAFYGVMEHLSHLAFGENHWQGSLFGPLMAMIGTAVFALFLELSSRWHLFLRSLVAALFSVLFLLLWHNLTRVLHYQLTLEQLKGLPLMEWFGGSSYSVLLLSTWAALYLGCYIWLGKRAQQQELIDSQHAARDAQLNLLRYQLNPHFMFNVLNSIDVAVLSKKMMRHIR